MKKLSLLIIFLVFSKNNFSQVTASDCDSAVNICSNANFVIDPNGSGLINEIPSPGSFGNPSPTGPPLTGAGGLGCLLVGELNSTWMIINVQNTGILEFSFGAGNVNPQAGCYDWIMYPYNSTTCSQIIANTLAPVRCNWNAPCSGGTGIANTLPAGAFPANFPPGLAVTCGQQFIICFSNYSSVNTSVSINFFGSAQVSCSPASNPLSLASQSICLGNALTLTVNASPGNTYTWQPGNIISNSISVSPTVTTSYSVSGTGACGGLTGSTTATVTVANPLSPNYNLINSSPGGSSDLTPEQQCLASNSFDFSSTSSGGIHLWDFGPSANTATSSLVNPINITFNSAGTYTIAHTITSGACVSVLTQTVRIDPSPVTTITSPSVLCTGQTLNFNASVGNTYSWSGPNGFTSTLQNPVINSVSPNNSGIYTLTVTSIDGCTATTTSSVIVNPTPTLTALGSSVCVGQSMTISANAPSGSTYLWSGPNAFVANTQNNIIANAQTSLSGVYNLTITSALGCSNTANANVIVSPLPTPAIISNTPCAGTTLSLNVIGASGSSFLWSGPNGFTSLLQNPIITTVSLAANGVYSVIANIGICSTSATQSITILSLPTPTITSNSPICENKDLSLLGAGGVSYSWSGPSNFVSSIPTPSLLSTSISQSGNYVLTIIDANGCQATATTSVTILPNPIIIASGATVCFGKNATLTATGGALYSWTGPNGFNSTQQNAIVPAVDATKTGNYMVVVTAANTCTSSTTVSLTANLLPVPSINATAKTCLNTQVNLQGSSGFLLYQWSGPNNFISSNASTSFTATNLNQGGNYVLGVTDNNGCQGFTNTVIVIDPLPSASIVTDNNKKCVPFCSNLALSADPKSAPITTVSWIINGSNFSTTNANYCFYNAGTYNIAADFTDVNGCKNSSTLTISAYSLPIANFEYTPVKPIENVDEVLFNDATIGDSLNSWSWYFANSNGYLSSQQNTNHIFTEAGSYPVALVVKNIWGCSDTIVKQIVVGEDFTFFIPNAFTPNNDGINDTFFPKGNGITNYNISIYDRWGEKLFSTNDFFQHWDGTFKGEPCKEDIYIWKASAGKYGAPAKSFIGHVTLTR